MDSKNGHHFSAPRITCGVGASALALGLTLLLSGCAMMRGVVDFLTPASGPAALRTVAITVDKQVNAGSPVAMDVVLVLDKKAFDVLVNLRAAEWFNGKQDFLRQYQQRLVVHSWEVVPGQIFEPLPLEPAPSGLAGVLVFADYAGGKTYRADATGMTDIQVQLGKEDFLVNAR